MDNVIDLEDYRNTKSEKEIESLKQQLKEIVGDIVPILPDPVAYFSTLYEKSYEPYMGYGMMPYSHNSMDKCPCCGYDYGKIDLFETETQDES